ncbi:hypothetical protein NXV13_25245 [Bacteroides ovatus]|nr:hypothetical protein [Bacteroides ovatus]
MEIDEFILTPCPDSRREESQLLTDFLDFYGILPEPIPDNTELENTDGNNLEESILQWLAEGQVMPTPTARDWKGAPSLENLKKRGKIPQKNSLPDFFARTGKSFQLNPLFVAEMMGFPPTGRYLLFSVKTGIH